MSQGSLTLAGIDARVPVNFCRVLRIDPFSASPSSPLSHARRSTLTARYLDGMVSDLRDGLCGVCLHYVRQSLGRTRHGHSVKQLHRWGLSPPLSSCDIDVFVTYCLKLYEVQVGARLFICILLSKVEDPLSHAHGLSGYLYPAIYYRETS